MSSTTKRRKRGVARVSASTSTTNADTLERWSLPWKIPKLSPPPMRMILGVAGPSMAGKTITTTHIAAHIAKEKRLSILFIVTEKQYSELIPTRMKNYDVEYEIKRIMHVIDLLKFLGVKNPTITISEDGKKEYYGFQDPANSQLLEYLQEKPSVVVIDSFTTPFNTIMTGGRQNFPPRNHAEEDAFGCLQYVLCAMKKPSIAITIHEDTKDPANRYDTSDVKGGKAVDRNHDYVLMLGLYNKNKISPYKWLYIYRWAGVDVSGRHRYKLQIHDAGVDLVEPEN